ncbi:hypothetical protein JXB41_01995 [Candidatus Woesearchaeota archaeon]|nr:hypothetical protein [Candidatus Woesearchaeota archaeon]
MVKKKKIKLTKQQKDAFLDKIKKFEYLRENRVAFIQSIFTSFLTATLFLFVDTLFPTDIFARIVLIFGFIFISWQIYIKSLRQTQKPVVVGPNFSGTIEKMTEVGEYVIFQTSDNIHQPVRIIPKKNAKNKIKKEHKKEKSK